MIETEDDSEYASDTIEESMEKMKKVINWEDIINTPPHYTNWALEPIDYIISNKLDFCEWNVVKYVTRYKFKNWLEDLLKARFYLQKLIDNTK